MRIKSALILLSALALIAASYVVGAQRAQYDSLAQGQRQLQLMAPELQSVLERFETLPFVLGQQSDLTYALAHPDDPQAIARLNQTLQTIHGQASVGALYLMDRSARTIGASNWDEPLCFAGKNFRYRPYYKEVI